MPVVCVATGGALALVKERRSPPALARHRGAAAKAGRERLFDAAPAYFWDHFFEPLAERDVKQLAPCWGEFDRAHIQP